MPKFITLFFFVFAISAFAQDQLTPRRYSESSKPGVKKIFRFIHSSTTGKDTSSFSWYTSGRVDSLEDGSYVFGYQEKRGRAAFNFMFAATDSVIVFYPDHFHTEDSDGIYEMRIPLQESSSWEYILGDTVTAKVIATGQSVTVPAGTYNCLVIQLSNGTTKYYAPDIGIVKIVLNGDNFTDTSELVSVN